MRNQIEINGFQVFYFGDVNSKTLWELIGIQFQDKISSELSFTAPKFYYVPSMTFGKLGQFLAQTTDCKVRLTKPDMPKNDLSSFNGHYFDPQ